MSTPSVRRSALLSAGVLTSLVFSVGPAGAALPCAPDRYERDSSATAAPLAVDGTTTRAICQAPTSRPGTGGSQDWDYFVFTASGTTAYTVQAVDVGAALANDSYDRGGLELGVHRLAPDGSIAPVDQNRAPNGDRITTPVLPPGRYLVLAATHEYEVHPETNTMDVKRVQGSEGRYGVRLTTSAPPPVVTSLTLASGTVRGGSPVTGTYTLSAPAPAGGMYVDISSSHFYNAYPGPAFAPAGATRVSFTVTTRSSSSDLRVTLSAWARVGAPESVLLTVRR